MHLLIDDNITYNHQKDILLFLPVSSSYFHYHYICFYNVQYGHRSQGLFLMVVQPRLMELVSVST